MDSTIPALAFIDSECSNTFMKTLSKVNLNLLKIFHTLMQERQVTLAAKKLHLTQSAISNSLHQLRELLHDELFIRGVKKMIPTKKALEIAPEVDQILRKIESFLGQAETFDYKTSHRIFTLGTTDYIDFILLPYLYAFIKKKAPHVSLKILSMNEFPAEAFINGQIELGIGFEKKLDKQLCHEPLFTDTAVCIARTNHPIFAKPLTLERYLQAEHIRTAVYSHELTKTDLALAKLNLKRAVKITIPEILPALKIISNSDLVGTFSKKLVIQSAKSYHLRYTNPPLKIPEVSIVQIWHRQQHNDPGLLWLRSIIKEICNL